jgi:hypothetical protein
MNPRGLSLQDSAKLPSHRALIDLVVPQAGQGMPVNNRIGHTTGPELKPSKIFEAADIAVTAKNSSISLAGRLITGITICTISGMIKNQF